ncbi:MAG: hypothetical protein KA129_03845 [Microthrixaceae bacterium]|nr:hypothetical protein [Microthrixaceae bacterium]
MAENKAGRWAARTTGRAESRQNGKGDEAEVVESWGLTQRAEAIMHTAHEIPTAKSAHARLVAHLTGHRDLDRKVKQVRYANGDQQIEMRNGGIIVYRTRTGGGLRGLDDISRLWVDEAQHAQPEQLASALPIMAVNPNPQTNFTGSGAITGKSKWWWRLRKRALLPKPGSFSWLEHGAERPSIGKDGKVVSPKVDPTDRANWLLANPAFPSRIDAEFLDEQFRLLGPALFSREHLGVWDPDDSDDDETDTVFAAGVWEDVCKAKLKQPSNGLVFAVHVNPDRSRTAITVASAGGVCGLVAERPGVGWSIDEVIRIAKARHARVAVASHGPAGSLVAEIERGGVEVRTISQTELAVACGWFQTAVDEQTIKVKRATQLDAAVRGAAKKTSSNGSFVWDPMVGEFTHALTALTEATWVATEEESEPHVW